MGQDELCLREHLRAKLSKSTAAQTLQNTLLTNGMALAQDSIRVAGPLGTGAETGGSAGRQ